MLNITSPEKYITVEILNSINSNYFQCKLFYNKDENVHRFALSAIRGELLERERV